MSSSALHLRTELITAMTAHARLDHPIEACGVLAGRDIATRHIPLRNAERSASFFRFDPQQWVNVWCQLEQEGLWPLAIYHSHTRGVAYPSRSDIELSGAPPNVHHVILSTRDSRVDEVRAYLFARGRAREVPIMVVR